MHSVEPMFSKMTSRTLYEVSKRLKRSTNVYYDLDEWQYRLVNGFMKREIVRFALTVVT